MYLPLRPASNYRPPLLRLKIWNVCPPSNKHPHLSPENKRGSTLGTIYEAHTALLMNVTFVIVHN